MSVAYATMELSTKVDNKNKQKEANKMENTLTVGSQFTTAKSKVSGVIQEVVENKNGSFRVRLDVNGEPRWTTVKKQSNYFVSGVGLHKRDKPEFLQGFPATFINVRPS